MEKVLKWIRPKWKFEEFDPESYVQTAVKGAGITNDEAHAAMAEIELRDR